ncbi:hypothetical protein AB0L53_03610 [Nonomuraea sp. NPDC052129]|uniref:hypothetical protein n=1 Tax=Nonomuraea sp. NPDC052129 TaxID=3154651 RepID=UPI00343024D5
MRAATASLLLGDGGKPEGVQKAAAFGVEVRVVGPKVRVFTQLYDRYIDTEEEFPPSPRIADYVAGLLSPVARH